MAQVYVLSEDDFDDVVYVYVLELLLATRVDQIAVRLRRGGGVGEVRKKLAHLMDAIRRTGPVDDTFFVIALDNDRERPHATHLNAAPRANDCRHCQLEDAIAAGMPDGRPIPGAVAVPVEMIEAWLLLMHDPARYAHESALPRCGWSHQAIAQRSGAPASAQGSRRGRAPRGGPAEGGVRLRVRLPPRRGRPLASVAELRALPRAGREVAASGAVRCFAGAGPSAT